METRSRKRAEASSLAPSSSSTGPTNRATKRTRFSSSASSTTTTAAATATATPATSSAVHLTRLAAGVGMVKSTFASEVYKDTSSFLLHQRCTRTQVRFFCL